MAPAKLTEAEKETIFRLYRETDETTSTLSRQYGVSVSTISRLLKSKLPLDEYEDLVRLKRSGGNRSSEDSSIEAEVEEEIEEEKSHLQDPDIQDLDEDDTFLEINTAFASSPSDRRRRRRRSALSQTDEDSEPFSQSTQQLDLLDLSSPPQEVVTASFDRPILRKPTEIEPTADLSLEDEEEDYVYSFGDEEFGDDEEDDFDEEDPDEDALDLSPILGAKLEILPLSEARFPRIGYLVIDGTAELVTCRLQDFQELGQIPESEAQHRTLPLFDNHRVARRFSRRNQRVIKLPDGRMLQKTARWLEAKGITRLLLDGKVYDLGGAT